MYCIKNDKYIKLPSREIWKSFSFTLSSSAQFWTRSNFRVPCYFLFGSVCDNDLDQTTDKASRVVGKLALEIAITFKVIKKNRRT